MPNTVVDEQKLKDLLKTAIVEVLEERHDLVRDLLEEALEDIAMARAIKEGENSAIISRNQVFQALDSEIHN